MVASIRRQRGVAIDGPITPLLHIAAVTEVGHDIWDIMKRRETTIIYAPLAGFAITPWRNIILLDNLFRGPRGYDDYNVSVICHEITHLLQRDLSRPKYFPSGGFSPGRYKRWIGDSTNYMEVLAYIVSFAVLYDLSNSEAQKKRAKADLEALTGWPMDACDYLVERFPNVGLYSKNARNEQHFEDNRIPANDWGYWLQFMGFGSGSVRRIKEIVNG